MLCSIRESFKNITCSFTLVPNILQAGHCFVFVAEEDGWISRWALAGDACNDNLEYGVVARFVIIYITESE